MPARESHREPQSVGLAMSFDQPDRMRCMSSRPADASGERFWQIVPFINEKEAA
jgi:hypothetical protein